MGLPLSAYIHRCVLTDANGTQNEGVNAVAIYYWDTVGLSWVKATGGAVPGANVNVTNFPAIYPSSVADGANVVLGTTTDAAVTTNTIGTVSGKLRGMVAILASVWNSTLNSLKISLISNGDLIDTSNSSTTLLAGGGVFTGSWVSVLNYAQIVVSTFSDQAGTLQVQFSTDGVNLDHTHTLSTLAGIGENIQAHTHSQFYRIVFTNGATPQAQFRMQSILRPIAGSGTILEADDVITGFDDGILTKSILTGQVTTNPGTYANVKVTSDGGLVVNQDITIDPLNGSTANLAVGATFTGATVSNIIATAIQVFLKTDQNCLVYVDQSQDGVAGHWDCTDTYEYFAAVGNFALTVNAVGAFYRIRVTNVGVTTTTFLRLQTIQVPILGALPRSLSMDGWLQCQTNAFVDDSGFVQDLTPFGEVIANPLYRVAGSVFPGSTLDTNFWTPAIGVGGTVSTTNGLVTIATGTTANNAVSLTSVYAGRFVGGYPNKTRQLYTLGDTGTVNNVRQWGIGDAATPVNGAFFELNGTTFNLVTIKAGTRTVVANGTFNGPEGLFFTIDTLPHFYEILTTPETIWWYIDQELVHTSNYTTTWSSTMNLYLIHTNTNSGGSTTNVNAYLAASLVMREGLQSVQPVSKMIQGATAGTTLKIGAGGLRRGIVSNITNNATVTLYDNTAASGTIIWASGAMGAQTVPFPLDFGDVEFSIGLTVVITVGANLYLAIE